MGNPGLIANVSLPVLWLILGLAVAGAVFWVWMLVDCARKEQDGNTRFNWCVIIILTGVLGGPIYYFFRRPRRIAQYGRDSKYVPEPGEDDGYVHKEMTGRQQRVLRWIMGLVLLAVGTGVVSINEVEWYRVGKPERDSMAAAIGVGGEKVDPNNDGKLVHVMGMLTGTEAMSDQEFGVTADGIAMRRRVWMWQWRENEQSGGLQGRNSKTYNHKQEWSEALIDSSAFHDVGYNNPTSKVIPDEAWFASKAGVGCFMAGPELLKQLDNFQTVPLSDKNVAALPAVLRRQAKVVEKGVYVGADPKRPAIGDVKVALEVAAPVTVSILARQDGGKLVPYATANGGSVAMLRVGSHSVGEMTAEFSRGELHQRMIGWVFGGLCILVGLVILRFAVRSGR